MVRREGPRLAVRECTLASPAELDRLVDAHPLTRSLAVLLPASADADPGRLMPEPLFHMEFEGPLSALAEREFAEGNGGGSEVVAVGVGPGPAPFALAPGGLLRVAVGGAQYRALGLQGARSRGGDGYVVDVETRGRAYAAEGSTHRARATARLREGLGRVRGLVSRAAEGRGCEPVGGLDGPGCETSFRRPAVRAWRPRSDVAARVAACGRGGAAGAAALPGLLEEIGACLAGLEERGSLDTRHPVHVEEGAGEGPPEECACVRWEGLVPPPNARAVARRLWGAVQEGGAPFAVLRLGGFRHSPVAWRTPGAGAGAGPGGRYPEHAAGAPGGSESDALCVVMPGGRCLFVAAAGEGSGFRRF